MQTIRTVLHFTIAMPIEHMCSGVRASTPLSTLLYWCIYLIPDSRTRNRRQQTKTSLRQKTLALNIWLLRINSHIVILKLCFKCFCCVIARLKKNTGFEYTWTKASNRETWFLLMHASRRVRAAYFCVECNYTSCNRVDRSSRTRSTHTQ